MPNKKFLLITMFLSLTALLAGCVSIQTAPSTTSKGTLGVFKSADSGSTWKLDGTILNTQGKIMTLGNVSITKIVLDPNDHAAVYLATSSGLFYSYDAGDSWTQVKYFSAKQITAINDVAIDYFDKCTNFVASANKIYKSIDCSRTYTEVYVDTSRADLVITALATEHFNNNVVYATNNKGDILKSDDYGAHWKLIKSLTDTIKQILVDKNDTRIVYFVTAKKGIFKTTDGGNTWSDQQGDKKNQDLINKALGAFNGGKTTKYFAQDLTKPNTFILACQYGLLQTVDGGLNWSEISLVTPDRGANIYALAIDPQNDKNIFYGTDTILYKSVDSGVTWSTQKAPTIGLINFLLIDPKDSSIMYLGGKEIPKN